MEQTTIACPEITEYCEGQIVELVERKIGFVNNKPAPKRIVIRAYSNGGYTHTDVDLLDVLDWVKQNKPELL